MDRMPQNKTQMRVFINAFAREQGYDGKLFLGLVGNDIIEHIGGDFLYIDHAYFNRGWNKGNFRVCRNWIHHTKLLDRPDDRMKKHEVVIRPWRRNGEKVVIIPPTPFQLELAPPLWTERTEKRLKEITDRKVVIKWAKGGLEDYLSDAWAVVTWASVAGVEAALLGIPVFSTDRCPSHPVSAGPIEKIETPEYADNRHEWACSLSYASWNWDEIKSINFVDYCYDMRCA